MKREDILRELYEKAKPGLEKLEAERTYKERADVWYYRRMKGEIEGWDEGEEIDFFDGKSLEEGKIKNPYDNEEFPDWFKKLGRDFGKKGKIRGIDDRIYTLKGVSVSYVDLYLILEDETGKRSKLSCVIPFDCM